MAANTLKDNYSGFGTYDKTSHMATYHAYFPEIINGNPMAYHFQNTVYYNISNHGYNGIFIYMTTDLSPEREITEANPSFFTKNLNIDLNSPQRYSNADALTFNEDILVVLCHDAVNTQNTATDIDLYYKKIGHFYEIAQNATLDKRSVKLSPLAEKLRSMDMPKKVGIGILS
jgi:hypothetical protein